MGVQLHNLQEYFHWAESGMGSNNCSAHMPYKRGVYMRFVRQLRYVQEIVRSLCITLSHPHSDCCVVLHSLDKFEHLQH